MTNTKVLKEASGSRIYLPVLLAISTGMRRGEILGLRWRDINFEERTISVVQTLQRNSNGLEYRQPQTKNSRRLNRVAGICSRGIKETSLTTKERTLITRIGI
ncbi:MAG: tyrosine-type recombinase/integrase [Moorellaceae bacterium]